MEKMQQMLLKHWLQKMELMSPAQRYSWQFQQFPRECWCHSSLRILYRQLIHMREKRFFSKYLAKYINCIFAIGSFCYSFSFHHILTNSWYFTNNLCCYVGAMSRCISGVGLAFSCDIDKSLYIWQTDNGFIRVP